MEKVSIVVPVYNTKKEYLEKCVDSIVSQTYSNIEVIIIDDGSKEQVAQLCDEFSEKYSMIKVIHKQNEGVSVARNTGIKAANGKWIIFVDSDDWIDNNSVQTFVDNANMSEIVIAMDYEDDIKQNRNYDKVTFINNNSVQMIESLFVEKAKFKTIGAIWGKMYSREFLLKNEIEFEKGVKMGEDYLFNYEAFIKAEKVVFIPYYLYHYRSDNNEEAVTKTFDKNLCEKYDILFRRFESKHGNTLKNKFKEQYNSFIIRQLEYIFRKNIYNSENLLSVAEKEAFLKKLVQASPYKDAIKNARLSSFYKKKKLIIVLLRAKCYKLISLIYKNNN